VKIEIRIAIILHRNEVQIRTDARDGLDFRIK